MIDSYNRSRKFASGSKRYRIKGCGRSFLFVCLTGRFLLSFFCSFLDEYVPERVRRLRKPLYAADADMRCYPFCVLQSGNIPRFLLQGSGSFRRMFRSPDLSSDSFKGRKDHCCIWFFYSPTAVQAVLFLPEKGEAL